MLVGAEQPSPDPTHLFDLVVGRGSVAGRDGEHGGQESLPFVFGRRALEFAQQQMEVEASGRLVENEFGGEAGGRIAEAPLPLERSAERVHFARIDGPVQPHHVSENRGACADPVQIFGLGPILVLGPVVGEALLEGVLPGPLGLRLPAKGSRMQPEAVPQRRAESGQDSRGRGRALGLREAAG